MPSGTNYVDTSRVRAAGRGFVIEAVHFTPGDLIQMVRAITKTTLPEVSDVLEGLTDALFAVETVLPYSVLVADDPSPDDDTAVNVSEIDVPIDILYIAKETGDGVTDSVQIVRSRLAALADAILVDFHLTAGTGRRVALWTKLEQSPLNRQTQYQQFFTQRQQGIIVMMIRIVARIQTDLVGA